MELGEAVGVETDIVGVETDIVGAETDAGGVERNGVDVEPYVERNEVGSSQRNQI